MWLLRNCYSEIKAFNNQECWQLKTVHFLREKRKCQLHYLSASLRFVSLSSSIKSRLIFSSWLSCFAERIIAWEIPKHLRRNFILWQKKTLGSILVLTTPGSAVDYPLLPFRGLHQLVCCWLISQDHSPDENGLTSGNVWLGLCRYSAKELVFLGFLAWSDTNDFDLVSKQKHRQIKIIPSSVPVWRRLVQFLNCSSLAKTRHCCCDQLLSFPSLVRDLHGKVQARNPLAANKRKTKKFTKAFISVKAAGSGMGGRACQGRGRIYHVITIRLPSLLIWSTGNRNKCWVKGFSDKGRKTRRWCQFESTRPLCSTDKHRTKIPRHAHRPKWSFKVWNNTTSEYRTTESMLQNYLTRFWKCIVKMRGFLSLMKFLKSLRSNTLRDLCALSCDFCTFDCFLPMPSLFHFLVSGIRVKSVLTKRAVLETITVHRREQWPSFEVTRGKAIQCKSRKWVIYAPNNVEWKLSGGVSSSNAIPVLSGMKCFICKTKSSVSNSLIFHALFRISDQRFHWKIYFHKRTENINLPNLIFNRQNIFGHTDSTFAHLQNIFQKRYKDNCTEWYSFLMSMTTNRNSNENISAGTSVSIGRQTREPLSECFDDVRVVSLEYLCSSGVSKLKTPNDVSGNKVRKTFPQCWWRVCLFVFDIQGLLTSFWHGPQAAPESGSCWLIHWRHLACSELKKRA